LPPGAPVQTSERSLGQIICASTHAPGPALTVLPLEHPLTDPLYSGDLPLRTHALLDGLAR
jgi:hypothetical protein